LTAVSQTNRRSDVSRLSTRQFIKVLISPRICERHHSRCSAIRSHAPSSCSECHATSRNISRKLANSRCASAHPADLRTVTTLSLRYRCARFAIDALSE